MAEDSLKNHWNKICLVMLKNETVTDDATSLGLALPPKNRFIVNNISTLKASLKLFSTISKFSKGKVKLVEDLKCPVSMNFRKIKRKMLLQT